MYKMSSSIAIRQFNIRKSKAGSIHVIDLAQDLQRYVFLLQEVASNREGKICYLDNKQNLIASEDKYNRAAIFAHKSLNIWPVHSLMDRDNACGIWDTKDKSIGKILLISSYWDCTFKRFPKKLLEALQYSKTNKIPVLLGIDSNAHSIIWGSPRTDARGAFIENLFPQMDLNILNTGNIPTFIEGNRSSHIDITAVSSQLLPKINEWYVDLSYSHSDHRVLCTSIDMVKPKVRYKRSTRYTEWDKFHRDMILECDKAPMGTIRSVSDIEREVKKVNAIFKKVADIHCRFKPIKQKKDSHPWFSEEIAVEKKKLANLWKEYRKDNSENNREILRKSQREYNKLLNKKHKESFKKFISGTNSLPEMARVNKILSKSKQQEMGLFRKDNGEMSSTIEESIDILMDHTFKGSKKINGPYDGTYNFEAIPTGLWDVPELEWMSLDIIRLLATSFKPGKAPGLDSITGKMLKHFPDSMLLRLKHIYESCWFSGYTPKCWLESKTVFITKPGKDKTSPKSQRPIGLLSLLFKLFEKLVDRYLKQEVLDINPLHITQHGFRKGFSTETALHQLVSRLEKATKSRKVAVLLFLDVEGAFDNLNPHKVKDAMKRRNFPTEMINWYWERTTKLKQRSLTQLLSCSKQLQRLEHLELHFVLK